MYQKIAFLINSYENKGNCNIGYILKNQELIEGARCTGLFYKTPSYDIMWSVSVSFFFNISVFKALFFSLPVSYHSIIFSMHILLGMFRVN